MFRILGPLEVRLDDRPVHLGGARQRGVLALLLLHANEVVASDRLIDELWRDEPPADAPAALQAHVSRLRKLLGEPAVIRTTAAGYTVAAGPEQLDLLRFRELVADGRRRLGTGDGAATVLGEALALWRGDALADLRDQDFMSEPIRELDELWLEATELRIDADLEAGRHAEVVLELRALVRRHPLRERLWTRLMLALYRSGRQAEALDAYSELRRTLDAELGLEPGPELRELQAAILRHDPELGRRPPRRRGRPRRGLALAVAGVVAAAAAAVALTRTGDPKPPAAPRGGFVAVVSPRSGAIQARVPVGNTPTALAVDRERTWVVNADDQTVSRIDAGSHAVETFAIGAPPTDVAAGADAVWVGRGGPQAHGVVTTAVARLDPETRAPRATVALPQAGPRLSEAVDDHLAVGAGALWAIAPDERVLRVDTRSDRVGAVVDGVRASAIAADGQALWALAPDGTVVKVAGRTNAILARGRVQASAVASIAAGDGGAWISAPADGAIWHATAAGDRLVMRTVAVPTGTTALAYGAGAVWAVNPLRGTLAEIQGERLVRTIPIGGYPRAVAAGRDAVWVASTGAAQPAATGAGGVPGCGRPFSGGDGPAPKLFVSDLPLQGGLQLSSQQMVDAMAYVLRRHGFRAGRWRVALQSCDDALASTRLPDATKCAANARVDARTRDVIAVLGPLNSDCARAAIPELARADDPLPMLSPFATAVELTRPPSRVFLRVVPPDDQQIGALALVAAERRGPVYVLDDGDEEYGRALATEFARAAGRLHLPVAGRASWTPGGNGQRRLAARVARAHPSAVFLGGRIDTGGPEVVKALRARLGPGVQLLVPDGFTPLPAFTRRAGDAGRGVLMALTGVAGVDQLGPEGRAFAADFRRTLAGAPLEPSAVYAAETMEVALDALARSDGTRASMRGALMRTRIDRGLIGPVRFNASGDIALSPITVLRVEPGSRALPNFPGVVVDSVQHVPADLVG